MCFEENGIKTDYRYGMTGLTPVSTPAGDIEHVFSKLEVLPDEVEGQFKAKPIMFVVRVNEFVLIFTEIELVEDELNYFVQVYENDVLVPDHETLPFRTFDVLFPSFVGFMNQWKEAAE